MLAEYVRKDPVSRDRLEIMNPGTLPPGWTAETLLATHESIPRNKVIAKPLDWAGYVERSGHGTEFIIEKCEAQGLSTPQYKPDSAHGGQAAASSSSSARIRSSFPSTPCPT